MAKKLHTDTNNQVKKEVKKIIALSVILIAILIVNVFVSENALNENTVEVNNFQDTEIVKNVALVTLDPVDEKGAGIIKKYGWKNPEELANEYIKTINTVSNGLVNYKITKKINYNKFPQKKSGFTLDFDYYQTCLAKADKNCRELINYSKFFNELDLCNEVSDGSIHEIWAFNGPWFGFWEWSVKGGKLDSLEENLPSCNGNTYAIMGFSYERSLSEMLEDQGHRFEAIMPQIMAVRTDWKKFTDRTYCGTVHIPPNSDKDYDWSNTDSAVTLCDDFYDYPDFPNQKNIVSCYTWNCNGEGYLKWWFSHLPEDWWRYALDTDNST